MSSSTPPSSVSEYITAIAAQLRDAASNEHAALAATAELVSSAPSAAPGDSRDVALKLLSRSAAATETVSTSEQFAARSTNPSDKEVDLTDFKQLWSSMVSYYATLRGKPQNAEEALSNRVFILGKLRQVHCGLVFAEDVAQEVDLFWRAAIPAVPRSLTTSSICNLQSALGKLLPLTSSLRAINGFWSHSPRLAFDKCFPYVITPFVLQWPTDGDEWRKFIQQYFEQYSNNSNATATLTQSKNAQNNISSATCCGGLSNPDANLNDADLHQAKQAVSNPDGSYEPQSNRQNLLAAWECNLSCPSEHKLFCDAAGVTNDAASSGSASSRAAVVPISCTTCGVSEHFCICHQQQLNGCLWWHCGRGMHVTSQLLVRAAALDRARWGNMIINDYRPGKRTEWKGIFCARQPLPVVPDSVLESASPQPLPHSVTEALTDAFPWSLICSTAEEPDYSPSPIFLAAPLAKGWVGGFIGGRI